MDWIPGYPWPEWIAQAGIALVLVGYLVFLWPAMKALSACFRGDKEE